jgi:hypothetical protein
VGDARDERPHGGETAAPLELGVHPHLIGDVPEVQDGPGPPVLAREGAGGRDIGAAGRGVEAPAVFPGDISAALRKKDAASLQELAESVRSHAAPDAAERLDAMASLANGRSGEALRRLRRAKEKASHEGPTAQCRAALALGVALASAGRSYEAALEGLEGISRARQGSDERGERACARFLAQIAHNLRDHASAEAWTLVGA